MEKFKAYTDNIPSFIHSLNKKIGSMRKVPSKESKNDEIIDEN